jgi:hypothetical protein
MSYSDARQVANNFGSKRIVLIVGGVLTLLVGIIAINFMYTNVDAGEIVVIQAPVSGELTVVTEPGWKWRGFGSVTS